MFSVTTGLGIRQAQVAEANAKDQQRLSKENQKLQQAEVQRSLNEQGEATAQRKYELARAALAARGKVDSTNLGDNSVRAIRRSIGFELGSDRATIDRNRELLRDEGYAKLRGINITRASEKLQIGGGEETFGTAVTSSLFEGFSSGMDSLVQLSSLMVPGKPT